MKLEKEQIWNTALSGGGEVFIWAMIGVRRLVGRMCSTWKAPSSKPARRAFSGECGGVSSCSVVCFAGIGTSVKDALSDCNDVADPRTQGGASSRSEATDRAWRRLRPVCVCQ